jgi:outer membrane protein OmpA-like peptidoglycan-associated protein
MLLAALPAPAEDIAGSADHPMISRYPGSEIQWYSQENYRPFRLPVGPITGYRTIDDWVDVAGEVTRIYYAYEGGGRTHSEIYANYKEALADAGFELLAEGLHVESSRGAEIGTRAWQEVYVRENPFTTEGVARNMVSGSASSGGSGTVIARKETPDAEVYVGVSVYQFRDDHVATLVDIVEVEQAETGLIVVDVDALRSGIQEQGRVVLDGVLFDFDKATIKPESKPALDAIAAYLDENPDTPFYVVGHTDSKGTFAYNRDLSEARARAVVEALVSDYGVAAGRLDAHGVGPLAPVFANDSDAARAKNRRVELVEQ